MGNRLGLGQLGKLMAGLDVEKRHRDIRRTKRFLREAQQADGVLATRKEQRRTLEFPRHLPHDVDGFGFEMLKVVEMGPQVSVPL